MLVTAIVKKCKAGDGEKGKPICLYSHEGKLLGRHKDKESAYKQEAAIKAHGAVIATLDYVADQLDRRGATALATEVDAAAESISAPSHDMLETPDERNNRPMNEMLDWTGFDENVLTRNDDVAEEIYEERVPTQDPYEGVY